MEKYEQEVKICIEAFDGIMVAADSAVSTIRDTKDPELRRDMCEVLRDCRSSVLEVIQRMGDIAFPKDEEEAKRMFIWELRNFNGALTVAIAEWSCS